MKRAAHYPLEEIEISLQNYRTIPLIECALRIFDDMETMFGRLDIIDYQREKLLDPRKRYAAQIIREYGEDYVKTGLAAAMKMQEEELRKSGGRHLLSGKNQAVVTDGFPFQ